MTTIKVGMRSNERSEDGENEEVEEGGDSVKDGGRREGRTEES